MAILSGKYTSISIALIISASFASYAIAATVNPKTQPAAEIYKVNEKELPVAETMPPASDIPPPDFKEFQDDKFINNLLGEDNKAVAKDSPKEEAVNKEKAPDAIIDKLLSGEENGAGNKQEQPAGQAAPEAKNEPVEADKAAQQAKNPDSDASHSVTGVPSDANVGTDGAVQEIKTETAPAQLPAEDNQKNAVVPLSPEEEAAQELNSNSAVAPVTPAAVDAGEAATSPEKENIQEAAAQPDILTEEEKQVYAELKKHLVNFVTTFQAKDNEEKKKLAENPVKKEENEKAQAEPSTAENSVPELAQGQNDNSATEKTQAVVQDKPVGVTTAQENKPVTDELSELLDAEQPAKPAPGAQENAAKQPDIIAENPADKESQAQATNNTAVADVASVTTVQTENSMSQKSSASGNEVQSVGVLPPAPVEIKNATGDETLDVAKELAREKPKAVELEENEVPLPVEREKLSEADKAYFALLEKKREKLPESQRLSDSSRETMDELSTVLAPAKKSAKKTPQYITIERGSIAEPPVEENGKVRSKIDLTVSKVGSEGIPEKTKVKLEKAYKALLVGQTAAAINIYKEILDKEPGNRDAMFGLATAYHKNNQFEQARDIYTGILKSDPGNKEALNNFLVLVAEEAPEDALIELEKLERINSDFSPIPAQIAMINLKLGNPEKAARYLRRAILLSPENLSYKYNLAITYDKLGKDEQAVQLYKQIIDSVKKGAVISGSIDKVVERMTYLERKMKQQ